MSQKHKVVFWETNDENCYPEIEYFKDNSNISVCISGGGLHSAIASCGWIKGLDYIGIKPKYISTVSGSSWFNLPYNYSNIDILGKYYPPNECEYENVCSFLTDENLPFELVIYKSSIFNKILYYKNWNTVIYEDFFKPYNLNIEFNITKGYPIINSNIVLIGDTRKFFPIEFTPLYHRSVTDDYFIDTESFNSNNIIVNGLINKPLTNISLSDQAGFSSEITNACLSNIKTPILFSGLVGILFPNSNNIYTRLNPIKNEIINTQYCDGGSSENTGIHSLIRRGETKIICLLSLCHPFNNTFSDINFEGNIAGLFGRATGKDNIITRNISIFEFNKQKQIFDSNLYDDLLTELTECNKNGHILKYILETNVIQNSYIKIEKPYKVKVLFILTSIYNEWIFNIPKSLSSKLPEDFPIINTLKSCYKPELIGALKQLSSSQIIYLEDIIKNM